MAEEKLNMAVFRPGQHVCNMQNMPEIIQAVKQQHIDQSSNLVAHTKREHPKEYQMMQGNEGRRKMAADVAKEVCHAYVAINHVRP